LGDIVYVELPKPGATVTQFGKMGEVESVKAVSDLFSPVGGEVTETNALLIDNPELANEDPFGEGWLVRVTLTDIAQLDSLMSAQEYESFISSLA
jgi:glycine cleavage system H protein